MQALQSPANRRIRSATPVTLVAAVLLACGGAAAAPATTAGASLGDPRIRRIEYSPDAVVSVHTRRGQVTHIVLAADEQIIGQPATGQGSNCESAQDTWCVAVGDTGRDIFVKPRANARTNNLSLVTSRRRHTFELIAVDRAAAAMRVVITAAPPAQPAQTDPAAAAAAARRADRAARLAAVVEQVPPALDSDALVANRMRAAPLVRNAEYSVAVGQMGEDLVPTLVFDDARATYLRFAGNRPLPAVFASLPDGSEESVNTRMSEDGLLVVDRVARRLVLRAGDAVAAVINEAFDPEGERPVQGSAVPGVARVVLGGAGAQP